MQRRTFLSRLVMMAAIVVMVCSFGAVQKAAAQPVTACPNGRYVVDLTSLPASWWCFPAGSGFDITTSWGGMPWPPVGFTGYPTPGIYTEFPPVIPGTPLDYINVFGTLIVPTLGPPLPFISQTTANTPCGPVCVVVCLDSQYCLHIKVYPGPCPSSHLPCW